MALPPDESAADAWIEDHLQALVDAISPVAFIDQVQPALSKAAGNDMYRLQFTVRESQMPAFTDAVVLRDSIITIEDVDYTNQIYKSRLVPDVPITTQRTLVPDGAIVDVDSASWTWEVTLVQGNKTGGLAKLLRDAVPGTSMDGVFQPAGGAAPRRARARQSNPWIWCRYWSSGALTMGSSSVRASV